MTESQAVPVDPADQFSAPAAGLLLSVLVSRAAALAREANFDAAESLLGQALLVERRIDALDLLARIRAQQGRLGEAETLWNEAIRLDATFEAARAGVRRIHAIQTQRVALWPFAFAAALVILFFFALLRGSQPQRGGTQAAVLAAGSHTQASPPRVSVPLPEIQGIAVRREENDLVATFEAGVFSDGVTLTDEGRSLLMRLGQEIDRTAPSSHVIIEGHCDRVPLRAGSRFEDDFTLGLARAGAVFHLLKKATQLPDDAFSLRSLGGQAPPFAERSRSSETRNRTVVIRIRP